MVSCPTRADSILSGIKFGKYFVGAEMKQINLSKTESDLNSILNTFKSYEKTPPKRGS